MHAFVPLYPQLPRTSPSNWMLSLSHCCVHCFSSPFNPCLCFSLLLFPLLYLQHIPPTCFADFIFLFLFPPVFFLNTLLLVSIWYLCCCFFCYSSNSMWLISTVNMIRLHYFAPISDIHLQFIGDSSKSTLFLLKPDALGTTYTELVTLTFSHLAEALNQSDLHVRYKES